jgi:transcriptional regulator with XRE-family HTH domain
MSTIPLHPEVTASWEYWKNIRLRTTEKPEAVNIPLPSQLPPTSLKELIRDTELSNHQIAMLSGVSPAYLSAFERGLIQKVGREKLLVLLMVALNLSLDETNTVLAANGYRCMDELDANPLIEASLKKTVKGFQIIRSNLSLTLLHLSIESLRGDTVIVHKMPEPALIPLKHSDATVDSSNEVDKGLGKYVHRKRVELFNESLERGENRYSLMCKHCLGQHLASYKNGSERPKDWIIDHMRNAVETLSKYDNFRIDLLNTCQRHWFRMKLIPPPQPEEKNTKTENSKVVFVGRASSLTGNGDKASDSDKVGNRNQKRTQVKGSDPAAIRAFATDNKKIFHQFLKDLDRAIGESIIFSPIDMPTRLAELVKEKAGVDL